MQLTFSVRSNVGIFRRQLTLEEPRSEFGSELVGNRMSLCLQRNEKK